MNSSESRSTFFSIGEVVVSLPFFVAATLVWWRMPPNLLSAVAFLALLEVGLGLFFLRTYIRGFPSSLRDAAEANALRLDGSESPRRTSIELRAVRKLRLDLLGSLILTLVVVNMLIAGCYLALLQLPVSAENLDAEEYLPAAWTMLLVAAIATCGTGWALLLRTFHLSMRQYSHSVRERADKYAKLDISRMQEEFQEEEIDYAASTDSTAIGKSDGGEGD
ncbi:MAG: hypothetical protein AB8B50_15970 [Pirellulaceae bacterium]